MDDAADQTLYYAYTDIADGGQRRVVPAEVSGFHAVVLTVLPSLAVVIIGQFSERCHRGVGQMMYTRMVLWTVYREEGVNSRHQHLPACYDGVAGSFSLYWYVSP